MEEQIENTTLPEHENSSQTYAYETSTDSEGITSQNENQTYVPEINLSNEEILKIKKAELKKIRHRVAKDKRYRLAKSAERRVIRDDKIDRINLKLKTIKDHMVIYNRKGKVEKDKINILGIIYNLIKNDTDLIEDIERTTPEINIDKISDKEIEAEAVDESEIFPPGQ